MCRGLIWHEIKLLDGGADDKRKQGGGSSCEEEPDESIGNLVGKELTSDRKFMPHAV